MAGAQTETPRDTIVLQHGSSYLRIGLVTDANPHLTRHIIAYKLLKKPHDPSSPLVENVNDPVLLAEPPLDVSKLQISVLLIASVLPSVATVK